MPECHEPFRKGIETNEFIINERAKKVNLVHVFFTTLESWTKLTVRLFIVTVLI